MNIYNRIAIIVVIYVISLSFTTDMQNYPTQPITGSATEQLPVEVSLCVDGPPTIQPIPDADVALEQQYTQQVIVDNHCGEIQTFSDNTLLFDISQAGVISYEGQKEHSGSYDILITVTEPAGNDSQTFKMNVLSDNLTWAHGDFATGPNVETVWFKPLKPGDTAIANFVRDHGITRVVVSVTKPVTSSFVSIINMGFNSGIAPHIDIPGTQVHNYLRIRLGKISSEALGRAAIQFKVPKYYNPDTVNLMLFDASKNSWSVLSAAFISEDDNYYYFQSQTREFFIFAITGTIKEGVEEKPKEELPPKKTEPEKPPEQIETPAPEFKIPYWWISTLIIAILVLTLWQMLSKKKK